MKEGRQSHSSLFLGRDRRQPGRAVTPPYVYFSVTTYVCTPIVLVPLLTAIVQIVLTLDSLFLLAHILHQLSLTPSNVVIVVQDFRKKFKVGPII